MRKTLAAILILLAFATSSFGAADLPVPTLDQDLITTATGYPYICGPTSMTETLAFWDGNGYPKLMLGQPSGSIPDMSSDMLTFWNTNRVNSGYDGSYTYPIPMSTGISNYFTSKGYGVTVTLSDLGAPTFNSIKAELDAGRPVILLDYTWGHYVVLINYAESPDTITLLWGHVPYLRTYTMDQFHFDNSQTIFIQPDPADALKAGARGGSTGGGNIR